MECDGSDLGLLHNSDGAVKKSRVGSDVGSVEDIYKVKRIDAEGKKSGSKRRVLETRVGVGVYSNGDEPIRAMCKLNNKRNPKRAKVDPDGDVTEQTELREEILPKTDEDLGGMNDTLAFLKKKLKKPRKNTVSVSGTTTTTGKDSITIVDGCTTTWRDSSTIVAEPSSQKSSTGQMKDVVLVAKKSQAAVDERSHGTVDGSTEPLDEKLEDSLSAFMLKSQSGSPRKPPNSLKSEQLKNTLSLYDELSPSSDGVVGNHMPTSQFPLELMTEVGGYESSLNLVHGISMGLECDHNKIRRQSTICTSSQGSKVEASSSLLIGDSVRDGFGGTCEDSESNLRSCPNTILTLKDGKVIGQICKIREETKQEFIETDHFVNVNASPHGGSLGEKTCDLGHEVNDVPNSASADPTTEGSNHSLRQQSIVENKPSSCNLYVCPKPNKNSEGSLLGDDLLNKSYEDTSSKTSKPISKEFVEPSAFLSDNPLTFNEKNIVTSKPKEQEFVSVSLPQREEASAPSDVMVSPITQSGVHKEMTFRENQSGKSQGSSDEPALVDKHDISSTFPQNQASDDISKAASILSSDFSSDEVANGSSSPSTTADYNRNYGDDIGIGSEPHPKSEDTKLIDQRVMRNTRKRRQWDMAYEGDADWDFLMHNENFIADRQAEDSHRQAEDEDGGLVRRRDKSKPSLTMFPEAKNGRTAAVSAGLRARTASAVEKIMFKEVLKRKGGLQMYLECRNHILGLWNKDVSCILHLLGCGVSDTPTVDESPDASLVRKIYAFLDHYAYINFGIASERKMIVPGPQVSRENNLGAGTFADSDDGDSFILGGCRNPNTSLEDKNVSLCDSENQKAVRKRDGSLLDSQALKSSTLIEPEKCDHTHGQGQLDATETKRIGSLHLSSPISPSKVADGVTTPSIPTELTKNIYRIQSGTVDHEGLKDCTRNDSEARKRIIVIGAGPAGVAAARHLQRQGFQVTVLEARGRIGGRVFTDRTSLSVPVDLGASIITGVEADVATERRPDPSSLVCSQLGLELTVLNSDCPLYDTVTGHKVPADLDETLEAEFNSLLDDMELLVTQKKEHAMEMSLEDGLEFTLQRRRLVQYKKENGKSNLHKSADIIDDGVVLGDNNFKAEILSPLERRVINWHFAHLEYGCAALLKDVSLPYWNQDDIYGGFGGAHCMIKGGYSTVVEALGEGLCTHLNHAVTNVTYLTKDMRTNDGQHETVKVSTSNGRDFLGDAVLITVPLGCLKRETIKFAPPLPHWKHSSIQRLGFGVLNKVVLEFPEVFWDDSLDYFGATAEETNERGHCFMFWNVRKTVGAPVLIALLVGKAALDGQNRSSSDLVNHSLVVLRKLFGMDVVPDPVASVVTDWGRDPYSYGAYSYVAIGASGEDYDILGSPVEDCLFFAGEATCKEHPDTVGGAMMSGIREAVRIINIFTTGSDCTAEVNAMEAAQRCIDSERSEVSDIIKRLDAVEMSNSLYEKSLDGTRVITRKALLQDMFSKAKTTSGRLFLIKQLLNFPARTLKSFAGTKEGLSILNSWILDSLGKDGTQLLRHCIRLLVLVSTDLVAVRLSGIGKTVKEKVCLHTSRDIRAVASQLVNVWVEVFRKEKASNSALKLLRQSGKPPLRTPHGALDHRSSGTHLPSNVKKGNFNPSKSENRTGTKSNIKLSNSQGSVERRDSKMEEKEYVPSEEEQAILAAEEAARAAAVAAAEAYASSGSRCNTSVQLPKIPSFNKFARREHYTQIDDSDARRRWSGGVLGRQDCPLEIDSRNSKVRDWSADFSPAHVNVDSSKRSVDNVSQRSYSNEVACQLNFREHSAESVPVDSSIFTKAWVDSAGSEGIKDGSAIERWQSQAAAADSEFFSRTMRVMDEEDSNINLKPPIRKHGGLAGESSASQVTMSRELVDNQPRGPEKIKQAVVDFVASLLMPIYKDRKIDKDGYKSIMKKSATKVMEQATDAEKSMAVSQFLDFKRKNKIRAFVDMLIERHMSTKPGVRS